MKKYAIVANIAGQFEALMRLVDKIPSDYTIILLGDLIDRGPDSMKVVQWAIDNNIISLYANHEDMFVNSFGKKTSYYYQMWINNGGTHTVKSYSEHPEFVAMEHIKWMENLPRIIKLDLNIGSFKGVVLTHGTIHSKYSDDVLDEEINKDVACPYEIERSVIWSRREPVKRKFLQISGHNSHWGYRTFKENNETYSYSIDQSHSEKLTALLLPSMKLVEESY
jgi:hypothetical protein